MYFVIQVLNTLMQVISLALLVYCAMSWFVPRYNRFYMALEKFLGPLLNPFRKLQRRLSSSIPIDFSPILLMLAMQIVFSVVIRLLALLL